jgi:hypothetical protein
MREIALEDIEQRAIEKANQINSWTSTILAAIEKEAHDGGFQKWFDELTFKSPILHLSDVINELQKLGYTVAHDNSDCVLVSWD